MEGMEDDQFKPEYVLNLQKGIFNIVISLKPEILYNTHSS